MTALKIEIVSGEGTGEGTAKLWTASLNVPAILGRLTRERSGGARWAYCRINGIRVADNNIGDAILDAQEAKPRPSGPTIPDANRRERGQARIRLTPAGTIALAVLQLEGEAQGQTLERVLVEKAAEKRGKSRG